MTTEFGISHANNLRERMQGLKLEDSVNSAPECWVYGFWFKNKNMRLIAKKLGLDWDKRAFTATYKTQDYVWKTARVRCTIRGVQYRGQRGQIMTFLEGDEHRSLENLEFSREADGQSSKGDGLAGGNEAQMVRCLGREV
ncbi:hypothetical protein ACEPAG_3817 [Sanghuangporus baumii]